MAKKPNRSAAPTSRPSSASVADGQFKQADEQRRVRTVADARAIHEHFMQHADRRLRVIAETRNQLEGGQPWDPKVLEEQGAAWQTNCNFRDAEAARDRTLTPYWRMANEVPQRISVSIASKDPSAAVYEVAIAAAFDKFIEDWGADYFATFNAFVRNYVDFGPAIATWIDPHSPRWDNVNVQRIFWPKNARMSPKSWDCVTMVRDVSPSELYLMVKDKHSSRVSEEAGWNLKAVKAAIVQAMYGNGVQDSRDFTRAADDLVQNDIRVGSIMEPLQVVWLYIRRFDGKIAAKAFTRAGGVEEFLFENDNFAEEWGHLLRAVWFDTGVDMLIHSIKGFGIKNYNTAVIQNRARSRVVDASTIALGMNFQRGGDGQLDTVPPVENYGPFSVFPAGMEQLAVYPQLQPAMAVMEMLAQNQAENNALYRQQQQQIQNSDTATQAEILANIGGEVKEAQAAMFLSQWGELLGESLRRLIKFTNLDPDAKKFRRRCREAGVPDEILDKTEISVKAGGSVAAANPMVRQKKFEAGMSIASNRPGWNARWFDEQYIAHAFGAQAVNKALLPEGSASMPEQRRMAQLENSQFAQGIEMKALPSDAHFEHAEEHLAVCQPIAGKLKSTGNVSPEELTTLTLAIEHTGEHLAPLKADPTKKEKFQALWPTYTAIQSILRGAIMRIARSKQQGVPPGAIPTGPQN